MPDNETANVGPGGNSSYSFWSWGGTYQVGLEGGTFTCAQPCYFPQDTTVWVNVTTDIL